MKKSLRFGLGSCITIFCLTIILGMATAMAASSGNRVRRGDRLFFGNYQGEEIQWRVLLAEDERALIISENILSKQPYNARHTSITWENCSLRRWLNWDFYEDAFSQEEQERIQKVTVVNSDNPRHKTRGGNNTQDKIFLLSLQEAEEYFTSNEDRSLRATWWLRSSGSHESGAAYVYAGGSIAGNNSSDVNIGVGVRPVLWLSLEAETANASTDRGGSRMDAVAPSGLPGSWRVYALDMDGSFVTIVEQETEIEMTLNEDYSAQILVTGEMASFSSGEWKVANGQIIVWSDASEIDWALTLTERGDLSLETDQGYALLFQKDANKASSSTSANVSLLDFNGTWSAYAQEYYGTIIPMKTLGLTYELSIENGKIIENQSGGSTMEMTGALSKGVLTALAGVNNVGDSIIYTLTLNEEGTLSCAITVGDYTYATYFCEK